MECLAGEYMTCPSTGCDKLAPACNCCVASEERCTIYLKNGEVKKCT
ncbi:hypothetical protein BRADI_1g09583v3 [Brachypodium distachyon]|uniref:Uncharacterized protein n=1 Tax=Brachypodium distachyon TaxID=15368 RepID=A0A0Q3GR06_BRADI|nr:hypothetical protein BRADI_1g09583v3 [Brachypodium distachyon]